MCQEAGPWHYRREKTVSRSEVTKAAEQIRKITFKFYKTGISVINVPLVCSESGPSPCNRLLTRNLMVIYKNIKFQGNRIEMPLL